MSLDIIHSAHNESYEPRYDMPQDEMDAIAREAIAERALPLGRFVCLYVTEGPLANVARTVERQVFESEFSNDGNVMKTEYGDYDAANARKFLVAIDTQEGRTAGVIGVLENSHVGLKSLNDATHPDRADMSVERIATAQGIKDMDKCWDVGTLAVTSEYRGGKSSLQVSSLLYRSLLKAAEHEGIEDFVSIIDKRAKSNLDAVGVPFDNLVGTDAFEYLGSPESYAVHGKVDEFESSVARRARILKPLSAVLTRATKLFGIESKKVKRLSIAAHIADILSTGKGLDSQIVLD